MKCIFKFILINFLFCIGYAVAGDVHTWHTVKSGQGSWQASLSMINQGGSFVTRNGKSLTTFEVSPDSPQEYGFIFDAGDNFDVAYSLTLTQVEKEKSLRFQSKTCVFVITAKSPAQPDIHPISFNGATCVWRVVPGVGQDFDVA